MMMADEKPEAIELLRNIKDKLPDLETLLEENSSHWNYEDKIYRFYHQSYKVYELQGQTEKIVEALQEIYPGRELNRWFNEVVDAGTGIHFDMSHNKEWTRRTRPIVEAFFHSRYFLEMVVKYGKELEEPPNFLPSGWASVLYLYDLR